MRKAEVQGEESVRPSMSAGRKQAQVLITPVMVKAAWVEARKWWPRRMVEYVPCKACGQTKEFRVIETAILVDEPMPGFKESLQAALDNQETT